MLADFNGQRNVIAAAAGVVGIRDLDGGRLQVAPAPIATLGLAGFHGQNHPFRQRHAGAGGGLERGGDRFDHFRTNHDVGLHGVVEALAAAGPVAVLLASVRGRPALHVDQGELTRLALLVVGEQLRQRHRRLHALGEQVQSAWSVLDHC